MNVKQSKKRKKLKFSIIVFLLAILSAVITYYALVALVVTRDGSQEEVVQIEYFVSQKDEDKPAGEWVVAPDKPRFMSIASLGVENARIVELGVIGSSNQLEDPQNIHDVGWYRESTLPGSPFNTEYAGLYDGHNTGSTMNGVFYNLDQLAFGDIIKVERGDGVIFNYTVHEVETPTLEETDMTKMMKSFDPGVEGLNIISCGGDWDEARQTYTHRVTVRALLTE
jgi:Sortase (surface protein transpeptidase)